MIEGLRLDIPTAEAFLLMLPPKQFKGLKGGRGGAKSMFWGGLTVDQMWSQHTRIACVREIQANIKDSVKQLIEDYINLFYAVDIDTGKKWPIAPWFKITDREIVCSHTDSLAIFRGLQSHTATGIKSLQGFNRAWYEEAQSLSQKSVDLATNTFRTEDSEQWFSWNPDKATDPVDTLFRENANDPDFICQEVNYYDNPWFPDVLRKNMERDRQRDPEKYSHIWLGGYRKNTAAQVFTNYKVERFDPPPAGTTLYFGADWGLTIDPTVLVCCFIVGRTLYVWREVWELGCGIDKRGALFDKIDPTWSIVKAKDPSWKSIARKYQITGDSSEPQTIKYLRENGFPRLQPAVKGPGSVEEGVSFLQSYDIVVHPDCRSADGISHVADELALYSYVVDKKTLAVLPELEDKKNHMIDSLRYALESVRRASKSGSMPLPF